MTTPLNSKVAAVKRRYLDFDKSAGNSVSKHCYIDDIETLFAKLKECEERIKFLTKRCEEYAEKLPDYDGNV